MRNQHSRAEFCKSVLWVSVLIAISSSTFSAFKNNYNHLREGLDFDSKGVDDIMPVYAQSLLAVMPI